MSFGSADIERRSQVGVFNKAGVSNKALPISLNGVYLRKASEDAVRIHRIR
jgi:hypothetical protein